MAIKRGVLNKYELQRRIQAAWSPIERRSKLAKPDQNQDWQCCVLLCSGSSSSSSCSTCNCNLLLVVQRCFVPVSTDSSCWQPVANGTPGCLVTCLALEVGAVEPATSYQSWMGHRLALAWPKRALLWYLGEFKSKIRMWHTHDRPVPRPALLNAHCAVASSIIIDALNWPWHRARLIQLARSINRSHPPSAH